MCLFYALFSVDLRKLIAFWNITTHFLHIWFYKRYPFLCHVGVPFLITSYSRSIELTNCTVLVSCSWYDQITVNLWSLFLLQWVMENKIIYEGHFLWLTEWVHFCIFFQTCVLKKKCMEACCFCDLYYLKHIKM